MESPKFSPGPWSVKIHTCDADGSHSGGDDWTVFDAAGKAICWEAAYNENILADIHLIAAAPELYAALDALVINYDLHSSVHNFALPSSWGIAVAALRKARGDLTTEQEIGA
jgi:hypothetical protein